MSQERKQILSNYIKTKKCVTTEYLNKETTEPSPHLNENLYTSQ